MDKCGQEQASPSAQRIVLIESPILAKDWIWPLQLNRHPGGAGQGYPLSVLSDPTPRQSGLHGPGQEQDN